MISAPSASLATFNPILYVPGQLIKAVVITMKQCILIICAPGSRSCTFHFATPTICTSLWNHPIVIRNGRKGIESWEQK